MSRELAAEFRAAARQATTAGYPDIARKMRARARAFAGGATVADLAARGDRAMATLLQLDPQVVQQLRGDDAEMVKAILPTAKRRLRTITRRRVQ